jgi:small subunit ribosomal protein S9
MAEDTKKTENTKEDTVVEEKTVVEEEAKKVDESAPRTSTGSIEKGRYIETVGRRKTAVARVRISESGRSTLTVNGKTLSDFFPVASLQELVGGALKTANITQKFSISVKVNGGGITSQAESVRLGIARALIIYDKELRDDLKKAGYLKRDPRIKERKKFGLKKARKAAQWSKR